MSELSKREGIKVKGHIGKWYVIDEKEYDGKNLYLLESEVFGDEAACIIINDEGEKVLEDVWNGWLDYEEAVECGLIDDTEGE